MSAIFDRVSDLAAWMSAAEIDVLVLKGPVGSLRLDRSSNGSVAVVDGVDQIPGPQAVPSNATTVSASLAGSFLTRHPLRDEPLAAAGVRVAAGQALGLIQVGDLLVPVYAPRDGVVEATLRENGALVGFNDPLFTLSEI